jgi:hypothetical protein
VATTKEIFFSNAGVPTEGLTLTWEYLKKVSDGTNYTPQPTFTEIGGGWYKYELAPSEKLVGVIDGSASLAAAADRYKSIEIDILDYDYEVFVQPVYSEDSDSVTFLVWLVKNGKVVTTNLGDAIITVYDSAHSIKFTLTGSSQTNGVFIFTKSNPSFVVDSAYYVVASVEEDDIAHDSIETMISIE